MNIKHINFLNDNGYDINIHDKLGSGTYSSVYHVNKNGIDYAMKYMAEITSSSLSPPTIDAYVEIDILKRLKGCPFVVELIDVLYYQEEQDPSENALFVVLERMQSNISKMEVWLPIYDGTNYKQLTDAVSRRLYELLYGLYIINEVYGIIHGDIKPENILYGGGNFKYGDFGLSFFLFAGERKISNIYTMLYRAPELLRKNSVATLQTDIWGLGITILSMLDTDTNILRRIYYGLDILPEPEKFIKRMLEDNNYLYKSIDKKFSVDFPIVNPLLKDMLRVVPSERMKASDLLKKYFPHNQIEYFAPVPIAYPSINIELLNERNTAISIKRFVSAEQLLLFTSMFHRYFKIEPYNPEDVSRLYMLSYVFTEPRSTSTFVGEIPEFIHIIERLDNEIYIPTIYSECVKLDSASKGPLYGGDVDNRSIGSGDTEKVIEYIIRNIGEESEFPPREFCDSINSYR